MTQAPLRVLAIEPFYGGSHRQFLDQWAERSSHQFDLVTFPARHWKWRMRHSAVSAAREVERRAGTEQWDVLFASSMLPLAELRGLSYAAAALPSVLYFHENQLTYPVQQPDARDVHYAYSNFVSACAADRLWFNSRFHLDEWFGGLGDFLARFPDHGEEDLLAGLREKASVQWPGVAPAPNKRSDGSSSFQITWAARWEHDKNPDDLFAALLRLAARRPKLEWQVNVLGEQFRTEPACFAEGREALGDRVGRFGFLPRTQYLEVLATSDVFVSTAHHEFFGIAVVEAMAAGVRPLLPRRLAYPELVEDDARGLYDGSVTGLAQSLENLLDERSEPVPASTWKSYASRFHWEERAGQMDGALYSVRSSDPR